MVSKISVPCRVIFSGEYFALYGAPALAFAVDRYVTATAEPLTIDEFRIEIESDLGKGFIYPTGEVKGKEFLNMYIPIFKGIIKDIQLNKSYKIKIDVPDIFRGMGLSSALSAAFTKAIYSEEGKELTDDELYEYVILGDAEAHGIEPIGLDARTVISGKGVRLIREIKPEGITNHINSMKYSLPKDTELLIIDTFKGKRSDKGELTILFSTCYKLNKDPLFTPEEDRKRALKEFMEIEKTLFNQLSYEGNPDVLGEMLNKLQLLLLKCGIVTKEVETVRGIALENGALGAKISGSGGEGALVLVYCRKSKSKGILEALDKNGYKGIRLSPAEHGVLLI